MISKVQLGGLRPHDFPVLLPVAAVLRYQGWVIPPAAGVGWLGKGSQKAAELSLSHRRGAEEQRKGC